MNELTNNESSEPSPEQLQELYKILSAIIKKHSIKEVVSKTRLSQSTCYRWAGDYNIESPNPDLVVSLLQLDSQLNRIDQISNNYGQIIQWFLKKSFPHEFETPYEISNSMALIENEYEYFISLFCGTGKSVTKDQIILTIGEIIARKAEIPDELLTLQQIKSLGTAAIKPLESLIKKGILKEKDSRYIRTKINIHIPSTKTNLDHTVDLIKNIINSEKWSTGVNVFQCFTSSLERNHQKVVAQKVSKFLKELEDFAKDNESFSETASPMLIGGFSESMISTRNNRTIQ